MAAPRPSSSASSSLDDIPTPPPIVPPTCILPPPPLFTIPDCYCPFDEHIYVPPPPSDSPVPPPTLISSPLDMPETEMRGRSRSRSRSPSRISSFSAPLPNLLCGNSMNFARQPFPGQPIPYDYSSTRTRSYSSYSRSPSPIHRRRRRYSYRRSSRSSSRRRSYSPSPPIIIHAPPPVSVPSPLLPPTSASMWATTPVPQDPVDILTFHYNKNMAYAPAAKTYERAIDNVLELWPELRDFDRDRIQLFVGVSDQLVRVPKMAWELVLCDFPRYEVVHVQVDQPPPPPQYQGDGKGNWAGGNEKQEKRPKSRGFFASIKRIFWH